MNPAFIENEDALFVGNYLEKYESPTILRQLRKKKSTTLI